MERSPEAILSRLKGWADSSNVNACEKSDLLWAIRELEKVHKDKADYYYDPENWEYTAPDVQTLLDHYEDTDVVEVARLVKIAPIYCAVDPKTDTWKAYKTEREAHAILAERQKKLLEDEN